MDKQRIFLDASVVITALLSTRGGSFYLLHQYRDFIMFQTNEYVLREVLRVLEEKFSSQTHLRTQLFLLLGTAEVVILSNPPVQAVHLLMETISPDDAPILASALASSDYLLTLDNDFFTRSVLARAEKSNLLIMKPKAYIERLRSKNFS